MLCNRVLDLAAVDMLLEVRKWLTISLTADLEAKCCIGCMLSECSKSAVSC